MLNATDADSPVFPALVSTFLIGKYHVTLRRYRECVSAGVCVEPWMLEMGEDDPVLTTRVGAVAFCDWDGGARLPTLTEWMKAARGPAPRAPLYPWWNGMTGAASNDHLGCDTVPSAEDYEMCPARYPNGLAADAAPWTASVYGVERMYDDSGHFVSDVYIDDLRPLYDRITAGDPSLRDPVGPAVTVGARFTAMGGPLGARFQDDTTRFRCVREVRL